LLQLWFFFFEKIIFNIILNKTKLLYYNNKLIRSLEQGNRFFAVLFRKKFVFENSGLVWFLQKALRYYSLGPSKIETLNNNNNDVWYVLTSRRFLRINFMIFLYYLHFITHLLANKSDKNHKLFSRKHSDGSDGRHLRKGGRPIETVSFDDTRRRFRKVHTRR